MPASRQQAVQTRAGAVPHREHRRHFTGGIEALSAVDGGPQVTGIAQRQHRVGALGYAGGVTQPPAAEPLGEDGDSEFGDLIEDSEAIVPADAVSFTLLQEQLHSVLDTLSEREAGVVSMRFGLTDGQPKTLDEIGKVYGVTRERIRQIESKTMSKLRHPSRSQVLRDYLD